MEERGDGGSGVYSAAGGSDGHPRHRGPIRLHQTYNLNMNYWLGRYHGILEEVGEPGDVTLADLEEIIFQGLDRA